MKTNPIIASPLNYTGGKYKLLPQILQYFPERAECFVDMFCGGASVGVNAECDYLVLNDVEPRLIKMLEMFKSLPTDELLSKIEKVIDKYGLSRVNILGYEYYNCNSSDGLSSYNKQGFNQLREAYNRSKKNRLHDAILLYVLIVYAFNNQIRFN